MIPKRPNKVVRHSNQYRTVVSCIIYTERLMALNPGCLPPSPCCMATAGWPSLQRQLALSTFFHVPGLYDGMADAQAVIPLPRAAVHSLQGQGCDSWKIFSCASPASPEWSLMGSHDPHSLETPDFSPFASVRSCWTQQDKGQLFSWQVCPPCKQNPWQHWQGSLSGSEWQGNGYWAPWVSHTRFPRQDWCCCGETRCRSPHHLLSGCPLGRSPSHGF